jgi:carbon monoxide dehydrogenase subunit G
MKVEGTHELAAPRTEVWSALHDPQTLASALPGLRELTPEGPGRYAMTIEFGVGNVRGVYEGSFSVTDNNELERCTVKANAAGAPGMVDAMAEVHLEDRSGNTTLLRYSADAYVAGAVAGVGQRLISVTAKRTTDRFIEGLQRELGGVEVRPEAPAPGDGPQAQVFTPSHVASGGLPLESRSVLVGVVVGFTLALIGIGFGRWTARR